MRINEAFWSYQAEGPYAGTPAFFIRLAGCPVKCFFCDTDYDKKIIVEGRELLKMYEEGKTGDNNIIVITGGEPLNSPEFPDIFNLVKYLSGVKAVQIETSGQYILEKNFGLIAHHNLLNGKASRIEIVISPKGEKLYVSDERILYHTKAVKFLYHPMIKGYGNEDILIFLQRYEKMCMPDVQLFVQPMYSIFNGSTEEKELYILKALGLCQIINARLSFQTHKFIDAR